VLFVSFVVRSNFLIEHGNLGVLVKKICASRANIELLQYRVRRDYFFTLPLSVLRGHEKKFENDQNRKIGLNEIKHLQLLILAKTDFFSRPAPPR